MYIFLKTTNRDEFNGINHAHPNFEKMTRARDPILDLRVPSQVSHGFGSTLRDESNGIRLVVLSGQ